MADLTDDGEHVPPIDGDPPCKDYDPAGLGAGAEGDGLTQCANCGHTANAHGLAPVYYYLYGRRVDQLEPPLPFLDLSDWMTPLNTWIIENYPDATWYAVTAGLGRKAKMKSVWVGTPPKTIARGDVMRTIQVGRKS